MNAHVKLKAPSCELDMESATAELCSLVIAAIYLQGESDMKDTCGLLLNIAYRTARAIEAAR